MIEIRRATFADAAEIARIYQPYVRDTAISFEEEAPKASEIAARIKRAGDRYPWLVAIEDEQVVAYAYATPHHPREAYRWSVDVSVYVHSQHHRQGFGRRLVQSLLNELRARNFETVFAGVTLANQASSKLWDSLGFSPVGVFRRAGFKLGAWHDVEWWQLALSEEPAPRSEPGTR
jgi:L-amino acid N-acyltransferase YncA